MIWELINQADRMKTTNMTGNSSQHPLFRDQTQTNSRLCSSGDSGYMTPFAISHSLDICVHVRVHANHYPSWSICLYLMVNCFGKFLRIAPSGQLTRDTPNYKHAHTWSTHTHSQASKNKYTYSPTHVNTQPDLLGSSWLLWSDLN